MGWISCFLKSIINIFSPSYIYALDKSFNCENENNWLFKEFGTHTYIIKTWEQIQEGNFIRELNPKDILYITQVEMRRQIERKHLRICEEKRDGVYILSCKDFKISVTAEDFLKDHALVCRTDYDDVVRIAYSSGVKKGRSISYCLPNKIASYKKNKRPILTLIK